MKPRVLIGILGIVAFCCAFAFLSGPALAVVVTVLLIVMIATHVKLG